MPSGNAMAVTVLIRLAALTGDARYRDAAERALRLVADVAEMEGHHPDIHIFYLFFGKCLYLEFPGLTLVGSGFRPHQVVALSADPSASSIELLADRSRVDGRSTAYVCHGFACLLPVTDPAALADLLDGPRPAIAG